MRRRRPVRRRRFRRHRHRSRRRRVLDADGRPASWPPATAGCSSAVAKQAAGLVKQRELTEEAGKAEAIAQADELRRSLLSAVSHDLRTPLAAAKAAVSSLRSDDVGFSAEDTAELLATVEESIDQLTALVGNLLDSSRLAAGVVRPELRPVISRRRCSARSSESARAPPVFAAVDSTGSRSTSSDRRGDGRRRPARTGAGQPHRQRAALRPGQPGAGHRGPGRRPGADRRRRRGAGHPARHRGRSCSRRSSGSATTTTPPASAWAFRWHAGSSRRWAARSPPPTPPAAGLPSRSTWRRGGSMTPHEDPRARDRRRAADPAGAADQPVGARLRGDTAATGARRCGRPPTTAPTSSSWTSACPTCPASRCSAGCAAG